jgi:hypothetical protein
VPPVGLANEITVEKEKRVYRLLPAEPVKGVPAKPAQPTESSGEGRELWGKETSTGSSYTASCRLEVWRHIHLARK